MNAPRFSFGWVLARSSRCRRGCGNSYRSRFALSRSPFSYFTLRVQPAIFCFMVMFATECTLFYGRLGVEVLGTSSFGRVLSAVFADFLAWARVALGRPTVATCR